MTWQGLKDRIKEAAVRRLDRAARKRGYALVRSRNEHGTPDIDRDADFIELYDRCRFASLTTKERLYALFQAIQYLVDNRVDGAIVECGVWRGGSMMLAAMTLAQRQAWDRELYLYDTFAGMTQPDARDVDFQGRSAVERMQKVLASSDSWGAEPLDRVRLHMERTGYPPEKIRYVEGDVLATIPRHVPERISLLRLDTDWYASTAHELLHLVPRLSPGGILIIDDYGHYQGARQAVDEYFAARTGWLFSRIDYSARIAQAPRQ